MSGDDVMASRIEKFNDTDFGYKKMKIEDYLYGKKFHLLLPGKRPKKIDSLPGNQTWKLIELPLEKKTLHNKFVYRVKTALDDSNRYNAILVENNFSRGKILPIQLEL